MFGNIKKTAAAVVVVAAVAVGGAAIGSAATSSTTTTNTTPTVTPSMPAHGSAAHEDAEKAVTGDAATKAQAAAVKIVGSGTAGAVTTDFTGSGYEVMVTKSDGSTVEIHLDSSFAEVQMPAGGPGPGGAWH
jgi:hypothetical protein